MSSGLNQFLTVPVPGGNGFGATVDVSTLAAEKSFFLSGNFSGAYTVYGTHDGVRYVPVVSFLPGAGSRSIRHDIVATLLNVKVDRQSPDNVVIAVTGPTV